MEKHKHLLELTRSSLITFIFDEPRHLQNAQNPCLCIIDTIQEFKSIKGRHEIKLNTFKLREIE